MDGGSSQEFRAEQGLADGVDGTNCPVRVGAGGSVDTTKFKEPIVGFVFGQAGAHGRSLSGRFEVH